jgi:hypothetical protein
MTRCTNSLFRRFRQDDSAAVAALAALAISALVGFAALVVDVNYYFFARSVVQASANAAALAGAQQIGYGGNPITVATNYSSVASGDKNYVGTLSISMASGYPSLTCATTWATNSGVACSENYTTSSCATAPCSPAANILEVSETANVPTFFGRLFGISSIPITATAWASAQGSALGPWNVALIVDTTASMGGAPTGQSATSCSGFSTAIKCAVDGAQTLLSELWPCASGLSSCTGAAPLDEAALFTFPPLTNAYEATVDIGTAPGAKGCSSSPAIATYYSGVANTTSKTTTTTALSLTTSMTADTAFNTGTLALVADTLVTATSKGTSSGNAVLTFASGSLTANVVAGVAIYDLTNPAAIPSGTTVKSTTATTVTMSAAVASGGVGNGDTIAFIFGDIPAGTGGNPWPWWKNAGSTYISSMPTPPTTSATMSAAPTGNGIASGDTIIVAPVYQLVSFANDYRTSDTSGLNASSAIVKATAQGCLGTPGGLHTYYADAINAAQDALVAVQAARVAAGNQAGQNVIILLSDASASSTPQQMGPLETAQASYECGAAVVAAQNAAKAGTTVYGIYFDDGSPGCNDTAVAPGLSSIITSSCTAMQLIANGPGATAGTYVNDQSKLFYSADGTSAPCKSSQPYTSIHQIFQQVVATLTNARLVPAGTS